MKTAASRGKSASWHAPAICMVTVFCLLSTKAGAQDPQTVVAKINGPDPLQNVQIARAALASDDSLVRSLALDATLKSNDARVKQVGFSYLIGIQKVLVFDLILPKEADIEKPGFYNEVHHAPIMRIVVNRFDKELGQFGADITTPITSTIHGTIANNGITILFNWRDQCIMRLTGVDLGYLVGELRCGAQSINVRSALR